MPHESDQPGIRLPSPWRVRPGFLYGVRQATLTGRFHIRIAPDYSFEALDSVVASTLDDTRYEPPTAPSAVAGLADRALRWMTALQVLHNIPVSDVHRVGTPAMVEDGWSEVAIAAPCYARGASDGCLSRVIAAINAILAASENTESIRTVLDLEDLKVAFKPYSVGGTNMFHFLQAALDMDVPFSGLVSNIFSFGMGAGTRWLNSTITDQTPNLGVKIAHEKMSTAVMLRRAGLPAPVHMLVADGAAAVRAAETLGYPVVVKPTDQEQGRGVAANLGTADAVLAAFAEAQTVSKSLLVEKHFHGKDYRLTVARGNVIKIENRIAGGVEGDGVSTIEALVRAALDTPRFRKFLRDSGKVPLSLDAEALGLLGESGLTPQSIPPAGDYVVLRRKNNVSTGGLQIRIGVDDAHPDNVSLAIRAAEILRLDFAGIDLLIPDIRNSWLETGALICEVNAQPQIGVRTTPEIYREVLSGLVADGGRIPAHLVVATSGTEIDHADAVRGASALGCHGLSTRSGVWIDGRRIVGQPGDAYHAATILLSERTARSALCIVSAQDVIDKGLPASRFRSIRVFGRDSSADTHKRELATLVPMIKPHAEQLVT